MLRRIRRPSPALIVSIVAVIMAGGGGAYAATKISGKNIKKGTIPLSAMSSSAKNALKGQTGPAGAQGAQGPQGPQGAQGPQGPAGASAVKYWAFILENGTVSRSSGNVTSNLSTNGGTNAQYHVTFPGDVRNCSYQVTASDPSTPGANEFVFPRIPVAARSAQGDNAVMVQLFIPDTNAAPNNWIYLQDAFHLAVFC
jgi:hypothetical protein